MWLVEVVSVNKQLSIFKKICFKYMISMIKAKLSFFWTSNSSGHGFHGNKGTILFSSSVNFPISFISTKLYFVEIGWVHKKLSIFKCTMMKTLNSDFLDWEDTLSCRFLILLSRFKLVAMNVNMFIIAYTTNRIDRINLIFRPISTT